MVSYNESLKYGIRTNSMPGHEQRPQTQMNQTELLRRAARNKNMKRQSTQEESKTDHIILQKRDSDFIGSSSLTDYKRNSATPTNHM